MNNKLYQDIVANDLYPNKYYYPFILHIGGVLIIYGNHEMMNDDLNNQNYNNF